MAVLAEKLSVKSTVVTEPVAVDIRSVWDWVKVGIEEILAEQPQLTYKAEDVYAACVNLKAVLYITDAEDGFVVCSPEVDQTTGDRTLLMWIAWTKVRGESCVAKYYDFFADVAREHGFKNIETRTPIPAMEQYLVQQGWTKDTVVYTRAI